MMDVVRWLFGGLDGIKTGLSTTGPLVSFFSGPGGTALGNFEKHPVKAVSFLGGELGIIGALPSNWASRPEPPALYPPVSAEVNGHERAG